MTESKTKNSHIQHFVRYYMKYEKTDRNVIALRFKPIHIRMLCMNTRETMKKLWLKQLKEKKQTTLNTLSPITKLEKSLIEIPELISNILSYSQSFPPSPSFIHSFTHSLIPLFISTFHSLYFYSFSSLQSTSLSLSLSLSLSFFHFFIFLLSFSHFLSHHVLFSTFIHLSDSPFLYFDL